MECFKRNCDMIRNLQLGKTRSKKFEMLYKRERMI